jgi:glutamate decarboxylase
MPAHRQDMAVQRILVKPGFSRDLATLLMKDYRDAVAHFDRHPVTSPLTEEEAGGFNHG